MDKKEKELEAPSLVFGFLSMLSTIFVVINNRGDENIFIWLIGALLTLGGAFILGALLYYLLYSFAHEVLSGRSKTIIIVAVVVMICTLAVAGSNTWGDESLLNHIKTTNYSEE